MNEILLIILIAIWAVLPLIFVPLFIIYFIKYRNLRKRGQEADPGNVVPAPAVPQTAPAPVRPKKVLNRQNLLYTLLMFLGVFLIIMSAVIFATSTWQYQTVAVKIVLLISAAVICYGAFGLAFRKFKLIQTSIAFYILGSIFMSAAVLAIGYFALFGDWFSFHGDGRWFIGVISLGLLAAAAYMGSRVFRKQWINWIAFAAGILSVSCFALFIDPQRYTLGIAFALAAILMSCARPFRYFTSVPPVILAAASVICMQPDTLTAAAVAGGFLAVAANAVVARQNKVSGYVLVISIYVVSLFLLCWHRPELHVLSVDAAICALGILTQVTSREYFVRLRWALIFMGTFILVLLASGGQDYSLYPGTAGSVKLYPITLIALCAYWTVMYICRKKNWQFYGILSGWPIIAVFIMYEYAGLTSVKWLCLVPLAACFVYTLAGRRKSIRKIENVGLYGSFVMVAVTLLMTLDPGTDYAYTVICLAAFAAMYCLGHKEIVNLGYALPAAIAAYAIMDIQGVGTDQSCYMGIYAFIGFMAAGRFIYDEFLADKRIDGLTLGALIVPLVFCSTVRDNNLWLFIGMLMLAAFGFSFYNRVNKTGSRIALETGIIFLAAAIYAQGFFTWPDTVVTKVYVLIPLAVLLISRRYIFANKAMDVIIYIYSITGMVTLLAEALESGRLSDALFIGALAFAITAVSAVKKNTKWFALGGLSQMTIAVYLSRGFWMSLPWWAYLLMAGAALTGIAIYHEAGKKKSE